MDAIYFLIPLTLLILIAAIVLLFWSINSDQYSDLDKEASKILFDDEQPYAENNQSDKESSYSKLESKQTTDKVDNE